jgi:hypothetical protein
VASNFSIVRGGTYSLKVSVTEKVNGVKTAYDITGVPVLFTIKRGLSQTDTEAKVKVDIPPEDHTDPTAGETIVPLDNSDTTKLSEGTYWYDFKLIKDGEPMPSKRGKITVTQGVTERDG